MMMTIKMMMVMMMMMYLQQRLTTAICRTVNCCSDCIIAFTTATTSTPTLALSTPTVSYR